MPRATVAPTIIAAMAVTSSLFATSCAAPNPTPQPASEASNADAARTATGAPSSRESAKSGEPPAATGSAPRLATGVEAARDACKVDGDCQLIPSCSCTGCGASKQMHVELCPEPRCKVDACEGQHPVCVGGACTSDRPPPPPGSAGAPSAAVMEAASQAGQLVLDDPRFVAYVHAKERPERLPMTIAWEPGVPHPTWSVGGKPARIVDGLPAGPTLVPTRVEVEGDAALFQLLYDVEGITVTAELTRKAGAWSFKSFTITER